ncbi:hypothetical protein EUTSA_v10006246mg [Eutrema salsugineum]|uniref:Remorin C-terminal domain-containing protein n=1 Tax=Eutrema salsugineum TaxID=72664 RepID=V4LJM9_EUTSA|nr:uncharacterized protein At3g61260 [Eutrema salsugineum]ESQ43954.1 hypothetical protein EUTSA_v10006246mg [Eutrema salsugineum]
MVEEQKITPDTESPAPAPAPAPGSAIVPTEIAKDVTEEKIQNPPPEQNSDDSKALAVVEKPVEPETKKSSSGSLDRDVKLADLSKEKKMSFVKAWEDSEKSKAENKAEKKISDVLAWENSKKAAVEAQLKKIEEQLEKKKAEYAEKMKNKVAAIHKEAEERRAMIEAKRGEDILKAEETAAKYRATGIVPKATCGCF